ncbi:MAG TPA: FHA domain-containing protein [Anaerolineae bacterium]|nr:FHA domain-containing protein [Anaerolineae bacterium]
MKNAQWGRVRLPLSTLSMVQAVSFAAVIVLLAALATPAMSQGTVNVSIDDLQLDAFPQVQAMTTVSDANGVPILELGADKFELVEDGRASFPPDSVETHVNPDAVISVLMVIDISGSMEGKPIEGAMAAANALLDQLSPNDRAAIIAFTDEVKSLNPGEMEEGKELGFTPDKNAVRNVVNFLDTRVGWDTPLYDAIYKGVKMAAAEPIGKRALVVMTDGRDERDNAQGVPVKDMGSRQTPDDPINEANRHNIPIFAVGLGTKLDTKYLMRLAERTGGVYRQAPQPEELAPLFEQVVSQLKTQYKLGYTSRLPEDTTGYHSIMVRVNLPQGQDFDEFKFQLGEEPTPVPPTAALVAEATPGSDGTEGIVGGVEGAASPPDDGAGAGTSSNNSGLQGIIDDVRDIIEDDPLLAAIVGAGILLLLILVIALIVVLIRGRKRGAVEYSSMEIDDAYEPGEWAAPGVGAPHTVPPGAATEGWTGGGATEVAPGAWGGQPAGVSPFGTAPGQGFGSPFAPGAPPATPNIPEAGGTQVIQRAPRHMAMLISKKDPSLRHDLAGTVNVGRARENQLVLQDPTVSRHHAWIKAEGQQFTVFDVGSANGTFVNDERVQEPRELQSGDVVRFGDLEFVFTPLF